MKKTLALVLALAMVFSTITVAFAEGEIGADAQVCADLGMLKGSTGTVDAAYTATAPTRIQAAIMFLRLKGLEAEATAFTGEANFADADKAAWAKPIMAYLKANPQLGWQGDGTNFDPTGVTTAQAYYKVMLEALGYKQNTAEVVGDFAYADVITFAASKGLTKVAAVTNFTVNDLAIATVEALKANVKDTNKTLVASLVEAGKVDKAAATTAGLFTETTTTTAALDTVFGTANDKVEVGFDAEVDKAFAENVANFKIVAKGSTTALEVKSAVLTSDPTVVMLTTAAQTGGAAYTLTVGTESMNFAGVAKNTAAPELDTVKCIDTNTVEIVFKKAVDRASAEDIANYTLDKGATVKSAELWVSQDDSRKTVKLTTEGVANSKVYTLKIQNVKSADLVAIKTVSKSFTGITDTKAPTIEGAIVVSNNERILVNFDDSNNNGIDKASAENLENWSIKDSSGNALNIVSLKAVDNVTDDYSKYDQVEVATDVMESGTKYTLTISNLADDSVSKNVIAKVLTKTFTGKAADKSAPTVAKCETISDTAIKVVFSDQNRLDNETLTNISNYTFEKDITVTNARILRPTKPDLTLGKTVILTTTTMDEDIKSYKLSITGVSDEFGNVMKTYNKSVPYRPEDVTPPYVTKVDWIDLNTVKLTFDATLDSTTSNDPSNYVLNNDIGAVTKAEISGSNTGMYESVTLTTPTMAVNKRYTITINGVKDLLGNATADAKAYFSSERSGLDTTRPEITSIDVVSNQELRVTFDEMIKSTELAATGPTATTLIAAYDDDDDATTPDLTVSYDKVGQLLDDGTTMVFKSGSPAITDDNDETFKVTSISYVADRANNKFFADTDDPETFNGNSATNEPAEIDSIEQIDVLTVKVVFDKPVKLASGYSFTSPTPSKVMVDIDGEDTNDAESTLTLKYSSPLAYDSTINYDFSANVEDYMDVDVVDQTTTTTPLTMTIDDEDGPEIEYVEAVNTNKIQVHYNEELSYAGTYKLYEDGKTTPVTNITLGTPSIDSDDSTIVNIAVTAPTAGLTPGDVFQIKPSSAAKDLSNNKAETSDVEFSFVASNVKVTDYIKGVSITDADTIRIYATKDLATWASLGSTANAVTVVTNSDNIVSSVSLPGDDPVQADADLTYIQVNLSTPIVDGEKYVVSTTNMTYEFVGDVDDGGIAIDASDVITFSGTDADDYVVVVVYGNNDYYVRPTVSGTSVVFDASTELYLWANATTTPNISLATIDANSTQYVIKVYRTVGISDNTVTGSDDWTTYKGVINNNIDDQAPYYTNVIKD